MLDRLCAALDLGVADGLHFGEALLFFVHANGDELDHLLGNAEATLDLGDELALGGDGEQDVEAVVEFADSIGETATSHLLDRLHFAATRGDVAGEAFDQLVEVCFFNVRTDDEHDFVGTIHSFTSFCEVLLRTALACLLQTTVWNLLPLLRTTVELTHGRPGAFGQNRFDRLIGTVENFIENHKLLLAHRRQEKVLAA